MSAESTVGEELEGVVSSAIHISIDSQSTLVTLERLRKAEIGVPSTAVAARFGRTRFDGAIGNDDFAVSIRGVLKRFREFRKRLALGFPSERRRDANECNTTRLVLLLDFTFRLVANVPSPRCVYFMRDGEPSGDLSRARRRFESSSRARRASRSRRRRASRHASMNDATR